MVRQHGDIFSSCPQRRKYNRHNIEAMIKVFTKATLFDRSIQVAICRCHDPYVNMDRSDAADPINSRS